MPGRSDALTEGAGLYVTEDQGNRWTRRGGVSDILEPHFAPRLPRTIQVDRGPSPLRRSGDSG
jgi:hypothetical protein